VQKEKELKSELNWIVEWHSRC